MARMLGRLENLFADLAKEEIIEEHEESQKTNGYSQDDHEPQKPTTFSDFSPNRKQKIDSQIEPNYDTLKYELNFTKSNPPSPNTKSNNNNTNNYYNTNNGTPTLNPSNWSSNNSEPQIFPENEINQLDDNNNNNYNINNLLIEIQNLRKEIEMCKKSEEIAILRVKRMERQWDEDREMNEKAKTELQKFLIESETLNRKLKAESASIRDEIEVLKQTKIQMQQLMTTLKTENTNLLQQLNQKDKDKENQTSQENEKSSIKLIEEINKLKEELKIKNDEIQSEKNTNEKLSYILQEFEEEKQILLSQTKKEFENRLEKNEKANEEIFKSKFEEHKKILESEYEQRNQKMSEEYLKLERNNSFLQAEISRLNNTLKSTINSLKTNKLVDRQLVNSLLVSYVSMPQQRQEILEIMSKILDWDDELKEKTGLTKSSRWGWIWNSGQTKSAVNLSDLWVEFLMQATEKEENNSIYITNEEKNQIQEEEEEKEEQKEEDKGKKKEEQ